VQSFLQTLANTAAVAIDRSNVIATLSNTDSVGIVIYFDEADVACGPGSYRLVLAQVRSKFIHANRSLCTGAL
jgi:hypothetical protein